MITVYVWLPESSEFDDVGHASIAIEKKYYSLHPANQMSNKALRVGEKLDQSLSYLYSRKSKIINAYMDDVKHMGRDCDEKVVIHNLDEDRAMKVWEKQADEYSLVHNNCSSIIVDSILEAFPEDKEYEIAKIMLSFAGKEYFKVLFTGIKFYKELLLNGNWRNQNIHTFVAYKPITILSISKEVKKVIG